jgi:hypothetical protein
MACSCCGCPCPGLPCSCCGCPEPGPYRLDVLESASLPAVRLADHRPQTGQLPAPGEQVGRRRSVARAGRQSTWRWRSSLIPEKSWITTTPGHGPRLRRGSQVGRQLASEGGDLDLGHHRSPLLGSAPRRAGGCPTDLEVVSDAMAGVAGTSRSSGIGRLVRLGYLA